MNQNLLLKLIRLLLIASCSFFSVSYADKFDSNSAYQVCFTPGENCTQKIVNVINNATRSILVQAYSFTSDPIATALIEAKDRGVDVRIILDKSQIGKNSYSSSQNLINSHIPVWIDYKPAIAHNKVIVIDGSEVITGSFNFTKAAQQKNAENLLIVNDQKLAQLYEHNWDIRLKQAVTIDAYKGMKGKRRKKISQLRYWGL